MFSPSHPVIKRLVCGSLFFLKSSSPKSLSYTFSSEEVAAAPFREVDLELDLFFWPEFFNRSTLFYRPFFFNESFSFAEMRALFYPIVLSLLQRLLCEWNFPFSVFLLLRSPRGVRVPSKPLFSPFNSFRFTDSDFRPICLYTGLTPPGSLLLPVLLSPGKELPSGYTLSMLTT